jgi:hypothetical protein
VTDRFRRRGYRDVAANWGCGDRSDSGTAGRPVAAGELYLSVNTAKTHQRAVYRKLDADGRRDAVHRARALQLL